MAGVCICPYPQKMFWADFDWYCSMTRILVEAYISIARAGHHELTQCSNGQQKIQLLGKSYFCPAPKQILKWCPRSSLTLTSVSVFLSIFRHYAIRIIHYTLRCNLLVFCSITLDSKHTRCTRRLVQFIPFNRKTIRNI